MPAKAKAAYDQGMVERSQKMSGMRLLLKPLPAQQTALDQLLADQQNPASSRFHQWLTPAQFGERFGPAPEDASAIISWLRSEGFSVDYVAQSRTWIAFSGTTGQVQSTFATEIHRYRVDGQMHFANATDPSIPAALAPLASAIEGLNDFNPQPPLRTQMEIGAGPLYTGLLGVHELAPADLGVIYDIAPLYANGFNGTGQTIAVIGQTGINLSDVQLFRTRFGLPKNDPQLILAAGAADPGNLGGSAVDEANLDLEWSGAIAPNATLLYVYSSSATYSVEYAIDQNLAPVVNFSYGVCELEFTAEVLAQRYLAQQANAQGITWVASSGDSGPAGCDSQSQIAAINGFAVSYPASYPEVTGVGGTELHEGTGNYWSATNGTTGGSALSYIPEIAWNDSLSEGHLAAGAGGASKLFIKPPWQAGPGVPADAARDVPDVAIAASTIHDGYLIQSLGQQKTVGGTSASAPVFSAVLALLNQYEVATGNQPSAGMGNINPILYRLAQTVPTAFHDVVTGNNVVPCFPGSTNCTTGSFGYTAGPGYDQATGLGSVDVNNLITNWPASATVASIAPLINQVSPPSAQTGGPSLDLTIVGANFVNGASIQWIFNGMTTNISAVFANPSTLSIHVPLGFFTSPGIVRIEVVNPDGTTSSPSNFAILHFLDQRMSTQAPPTGGACTVPPVTSSFLTTDRIAYLFYEGTIAPSDLLSSDWLAPDGSVYTGFAWPQNSGTFCFPGAALSLTSIPANEFGTWQARVYDTGALLFSVPFTVSSPATAAQQILPQFVFGGGWYSALYFTNTGSAPVSFPVAFQADDGTPLTVPSIGASSETVTLPPYGTTILEAPNVGALSQGYASAALPSGVTGYGVFRQSVPGVPDQEAVVGFSTNAATSSTLIWDDTAYTTAVALVNLSANTDAVLIVVRDLTGAIIGSTTVTMAGNSHQATVLRNLPGLEGMAGNRGSATFTMNFGSLVVLGLRFNGTAFTSIPAQNTTAISALATQPVLPQFAFGGGWYSALYFTATGPTTTTSFLTFVADDGTPLLVPSVGASETVGLGVQATSITEALNTGSLNQGYVSTTLGAGVTGYGVFRQSVPGVPDQEAVVPLSSGTAKTSTLIWDDTAYTTAIAIANSSSTAITVQIVIQDPTGATIGSTTIPLAAKSHTALVLRDVPGFGAMAGNRGSATLTASAPSLSVLGLRFNGTAFTSIPTFDQ